MTRFEKPIHSFYDPDFEGENGHLAGDELHHCVQVLRHQAGDTMRVTNGKGLLGKVRILEVSKKLLRYSTLEKETFNKKNFGIHLFIAPTKRIDRMEWMVEKLGELHTDHITFVRTANSERNKIRLDRLERKLISAMKQSHSAWKTHLNELTDFDQILEKIDETTLMAHVSKQRPYITRAISTGSHVKILIGPEGDFTQEEVEKTLDRGAKAISLGRPVLRTETAALMACQAINFINQY